MGDCSVFHARYDTQTVIKYVQSIRCLEIFLRSIPIGSLTISSIRVVFHKNLVEKKKRSDSSGDSNQALSEKAQSEYN